MSDVFTSGESHTFANYVGSGDGRMILKPMEVMVTISEGESLKLGIRTSNHRGDGTRVTGNNHGCFKVDHFRIQKIKPVDGETAIESIQNSKFKFQNDGAIYDLSGRMIFKGKLSNSSPLPLEGTGEASHSSLKKGIYIVNGEKRIVR